MNTNLETIIAKLGTVIARHTSNWAEAEAILGASGTSRNRKVDAETLGAKREAAHGHDAKSTAGKEKLTAFKTAAKVLNALDVLVDYGALDLAEVETARLAIKAAASKSADKKAA